MRSRPCLFALATLAACGPFKLAPAPGSGPAPAPLTRIDGEYAFSGSTDGAGIIAGQVRFDSSGRATVRANGANCEPVGRGTGKMIGFSCGDVSVALQRRDRGLGERGAATLSVARRVMVQGAGYDCPAWYPAIDGTITCSNRGMTTVTERHTYFARLSVWRVDRNQ